MGAFNLKATTIQLLLLLVAIATTLNQSHAKHKQPNSLVLGITRTRAFTTHPPANLDIMMEPLRGFKDGYLLSLNLGTPTQTLQAYMDTGSDLSWFPCGSTSFNCMECNAYTNYNLMPSFSPSLSSTSSPEPCTTNLCADIHSSDNPFDPCATAGCPLISILEGTCPSPCPSFAYNYGAGGLVIGNLTRDTLRVHGRMRDISSFCFGCVSSTFKEPIGIVGFGRGALSLPSQLGLLRKGFSHCFLGFKLANNPNMTSPLVLGELVISSKDHILFTPMLNNIMYPSFYYIGLEGITVGNGSTIRAPLSLRSFDSVGDGGMIIDSGTTYTHLPDPFYDELLVELGSKVAYERSIEHEVGTGFDLCYKVPYSNNNSSSDELPVISFLFMNNVELVLPEENCFYAVGAPKESMVVKCLLFQRMDDEYGPGGVFGSFQQQNVEVLYDNDKERVGFQAMDCASSAAYHGLNHN